VLLWCDDWIAAVLKQKCARMHQIPFQFLFFRGNTPTPATGTLSQTQGREGRGGEGRERAGRGKGSKGRGGEGKADSDWGV